MKVVALVSGGKDSCFSMHLCAAHGHEVVALANLLPPDSDTDELDSYMYQTVGHQLVAAYASCTGLPLYRRRILGTSHSQGLTYSATAGDEVEDLLLLLAFVRQRHPEVTAVASGAIASDYQRLRVESVCSRLGLVSLGFLWHQPQDALLSDMISANIEAVLVKVAAIGLDPHKHLGRSIRQMQPTLRRLRSRFGCNVCGEGGEYETLTLDCPAFTRGRILLDDWQVVLHSPDSIAPVGVLHPTAFRVEPKPAGAAAAAATNDAAVLGAAAVAKAVVIEVPADWTLPATQPAAGDGTSSSGSSGSSQGAAWDIQMQVSVSDLHVHVVASATQPAAAAGPVAAADTAAALGAALAAITAALPAAGVAWDSSCFVHLYLADMAHFSTANEEYCRHLPQVNPPSRACVQVPLPAGCPVLLDVLFARPKQQQQEQRSPEAAAAAVPAERRVLHVQSISAWAPSCIGPYSQATACNGLIYMAGQIPLDPASMSIVHAMPPAAAPTASSSSSSSVCGRLAAQVWRSLLSCQAVAVAVKSCVARAALGLTVYLTEEAQAAGGQQLVQAALQAIWADRSCLERQDMPPLLLAAAAAAASDDSGGGSDYAATAAEFQHQSSEAEDDGGGSDADEAEHESFVDEYLLPPAVQQPLQPAVVYIAVPALPRGAMLEVQPVLLDLRTAHAAHSSSSDSDSAIAGGRTAAGAAVHVTSACSGGRDWNRVLLHLTDSPESPQQASVASRELAAVVQDLRQHQQADACSAEEGGAVCMLRCWYDVGAAAAADALSAELRAAGLGAGGGPAAVQQVPVAGVASSASDQGWGPCWAVLEALVAT